MRANATPSGAVADVPEALDDTTHTGRSDRYGSVRYLRDTLQDLPESSWPPGRVCGQTLPRTPDPIVSPAGKSLTPTVFTQAGMAVRMDSLGSGGPPAAIPDTASLALSYDEIADGEVIGRGGNADVFRVTVQRGGREIPVAVKQPRLQGTLDTDTVERFVQEAEVWAELDGHDHIVSLYDWGAEPLPWLAMEYMDRGTLADVPDGERLPLDQALWVGACVCNAVHHAHRHGVAHHDIKPANVLFISSGDGWAVPKVSDWGLARLLLEETGSVEGLSPHYAAPEQFDAQQYGSPDDRTDIYQVGTLVYELVTGRPPFEGSATAVMQGVLSTEPTPPSEVANVPAELDDILGEAIAKEPAERYESVLYLRDRLQELFDALDEQQSSSDDGAGTMPANSRSVTETKGGTANEETEDHALTGSADADEETPDNSRSLSRRVALGSIGLGVVGVGGLGLLQTMDRGAGGNDNDGINVGDTGSLVTPEGQVDAYLTDTDANNYDGTGSIVDETGTGSLTIEVGPGGKLPVQSRSSPHQPGNDCDLGVAVGWSLGGAGQPRLRRRQKPHGYERGA